MRYSDNVELFSKKLIEDLTAFDEHYAFFVGDLLDAAHENLKVNVIEHSPGSDAFTDVVEDLVLNDNYLEIIFRTRGSMNLVLSRKEMEQVSAARYHVNCEDAGQVLNITFIK